MLPLSPLFSRVVMFSWTNQSSYDRRAISGTSFVAHLWTFQVSQYLFQDMEIMLRWRTACVDAVMPCNATSGAMEGFFQQGVEITCSCSVQKFPLVPSCAKISFFIMCWHFGTWHYVGHCAGILVQSACYPGHVNSNMYFSSLASVFSQ